MGTRFSRIKQGAYYNAALQGYIDYWNTAATRPRRIGQQGPRGATALAYVTPFGFDVATDEVLAARVNPTHYTALQTAINGADGGQVTNTLGANSLIKERGFRPSRVVWQRAADRAVSTPNSQFTGLEYLKYDNLDRFSCPFGRETATDDEIDVFNRIKSTLLNTGTYEVNRVSLQRERCPI